MIKGNLFQKLSKFIFPASSRKNKFWSFVSSVGQFVLLGFKQMAGYSAKLVLGKIVGVLGIFSQFFMISKMLKVSGVKGWRKIFSFIFLFTGITSFVGVYLLFQGSPFMGVDIHGAEYMARGFFVLALLFAGADWLSVALGNYPGLFIHKSLVNQGSGLGIMDSRTDDLTGRTWGTKIFGKKISVPRFGQKIRLALGVLSLVVAIFHICHEPKACEQNEKIEQTIPKFNRA